MDARQARSRQEGDAHEGREGPQEARHARAVPIWTHDGKHAAVERHGEQARGRGKVGHRSSAAGYPS